MSVHELMNEVHSSNESPSLNKSLLTGSLTNDHEKSPGELKMDMNDLITQGLQKETGQSQEKRRGERRWMKLNQEKGDDANN